MIINTQAGLSTENTKTKIINSARPDSCINNCEQKNKRKCI